MSTAAGSEIITEKTFFGKFTQLRRLTQNNCFGRKVISLLEKHDFVPLCYLWRPVISVLEFWHSSGVKLSEEMPCPCLTHKVEVTESQQLVIFHHPPTRALWVTKLQGLVCPLSLSSAFSKATKQNTNIKDFKNCRITTMFIFASSIVQLYRVFNVCDLTRYWPLFQLSSFPMI